MTKKTRKSRTEAFLLLPRRALRSMELNQLSVHARWLYIILMTEWKRGGEEEKSFVMTYSQIKRITRFRNDRTAKCLKELSQAGFLEINHGGLERNPNHYKANLDWVLLKKNE